MVYMPPISLYLAASFVANALPITLGTLVEDMVRLPIRAKRKPRT